jgi:hypothetical protein
MADTRTKQELIEAIDDLEAALDEVYAEASSDEPDIERIAAIAAEALGIESSEEDDDEE